MQQLTRILPQYYVETLPVQALPSHRPELEEIDRIASSRPSPHPYIRLCPYNQRILLLNMRPTLPGGGASAKTITRQLIRFDQQTRSLSNEHLLPLGIDCEVLDGSRQDSRVF